ncbi:hemerythrin domain-containing protein [Streptomyces sp. NPDC051569]|uniref:hemerythrin domain-containing protein n=1 Tax=Streptomyces sp. NPDC051569 TaxID=3365661 RepID=UPI00379F2326
MTRNGKPAGGRSGGGKPTGGRTTGGKPGGGRASGGGKAAGAGKPAARSGGGKAAGTARSGGGRSGGGRSGGGKPTGGRSGGNPLPNTPQGKALVDELLMVHDSIRRDLATVRKLAQRVTKGLTAKELSADLKTLQTRGPLWQLRVNCLQHCRHVHTHHSFESAMMFPALKAANPQLRPAVNRLEAEHRAISDLLDEVQGAASALAEDISAEARQRVVKALDTFADQLLKHLSYEEEQIIPTLRRWQHQYYF